MASDHGTACKDVTPRRALIQSQIQGIVTEAWKDEEFKKKLLADPKGTIEAFFKIELPADTVVKAFDQMETKAQNPPIYLNLPPKPEGMSVEELDKLATNDFQCKAFGIDAITDAIEANYTSWEKPW